MFGHDVSYYPNGIEAGNPVSPSLTSVVVLNVTPGETTGAETVIAFSQEVNAGVLEIDVFIACETTSYDDYLLVPVS